MADHYQMYINGEWVDALDGETYESYNPYTGDVFARVAAGKRDDAKRAIEAAQAAFPAWSRTLPAERQMLFLKAAGILEGKRDEIVRIIADEIFICLERALDTTTKWNLKHILGPKLVAF